MRPPILPNMTVVPIAAERAVSDTTFAALCACVSAPKEKAPAAIKNVAAYRAVPLVVARKITYPGITIAEPIVMNILRRSSLQLIPQSPSTTMVPKMYGGTVSNCWVTTGFLGYIDRTMVGKKNANPWTVTLINSKIIDVDNTTGLNIPRINLVRSILSRSSCVVTRSERTRVTASFFSSGVSQRAVSGLSVKVKKAMRATPTVTMPTLVSLEFRPLIDDAYLRWQRSSPNSSCSQSDQALGSQMQASLRMRQRWDP